MQNGGRGINILGQLRHSRRSNTAPSTSYTTLARRPHAVYRNGGLLAHPTVLLIHMSAIFTTMMFIPAIVGARATTSSATLQKPLEAPSQEDATSTQPTVSTFLPSPPPYDPTTYPNPSPAQLRKLASTIRSQLSSRKGKNPFDGLFTLRQLHMLKPIPHFENSPPTEKWVWRLPAASAIHAILRLVAASPDPNSPNLKELVDIAARLTSNSLQWDQSALHSQSASVNPERSDGGKLFGGKMVEKGEVANVDTAVEARVGILNKEPKEHRVAELVREEQADKLWEEAPLVAAEKRKMKLERQKRRIDSREENGSPKVESTTVATPISPSTQLPSVPFFQTSINLHPPQLSNTIRLSSLPASVLETIYLFLANIPSPSPYAHQTSLAFSLTLKDLNVPQSPPMLAHSFDMLLKEQRIDLATEIWGKWVDSVQRKAGYSSSGPRLGFQQIQKVLSARGKAQSPAPRKKALSSIAFLGRVLERQWKTVTSVHKGEKVQYSPLSNLLHYLAIFPASPYAHDFQVESDKWHSARYHFKVERMLSKIFRDIIQDVVGRHIYLKPLSVIMGGERVADTAKRIPLSLKDYNTLIDYSLYRFESPELAMLLLKALRAAGHKPTAATYNTLLSATSDTPAEAMANIKRRPHNDQTLPTFLTYLTANADFANLDQLVFAILPELDHSLTPSILLSPTTQLPSSTTPPLDRNPYLYITLLNALAKAGRTGLAERVFRLARWAAELSREEQVDSKIKKWILPPHAFTIMLQLYAMEVKRGQRLEGSYESDSSSSTTEDSSPYVRGWGRHALRVFRLKSQQQELRDQTGASADVRQPTRSIAPLPSILRREAAPIVAEWELEGGSKGPELESLKSALKSEFSQSALEILFPRTKRAQIFNGVRQRAVLKSPMRERQSVRRKKMRDASALGKKVTPSAGV